ncbi:bacterial DNA-binding protein, DNABII family [Malacoplasma iowae DK-CPA]|uniref:Viral histone-like protein n=2 Tax=Malacoplasma iowae TaxID=2116 RepID=A0A084U3K8_MALIO|nr:bacterial DNA-binding protein, DNABII family [Malacoplasma iowae DK-CPA]
MEDRMAVKSMEKLVIDSGKPLTKREIYKLISNNINISETVIKDIFDDFTKLMFAELDRCGEFKLLDLGKIKVTHSDARLGKNPLTGENTVFKSKTKLKFSFSKQCKEFAETLYV